eukprot:TRINITY_DN92741_c0_g1_i1.p1 TRINITY_DN92741_c0_g1~~TRINITY_DN92741_c0_g1_i1.p1  ORF type:complete len:1046 (-),score=213.19 TRINITY_DN92741_c0_g1_i1:25-3162(-)
MRSSRSVTAVADAGMSASVVVRARPPLLHEAPYGHCARTDGRRVVLTTSAQEGGVEKQRQRQQLQPRIRAVECEYDKVLGMNDSQRDVWQSVLPTVEKVLEGYNVTIFTYGMTGSGKTFTMLGPKLMESAFEGEDPPSVAEIQSDEQRGLVPRVMQYIFDKVGGQDTDVSLSYLQVYQERCYDLLQPAVAAKPLRIRQDRLQHNHAGSVYLEGLTECPVRSAEECFERLLYGFSNVAFRSTNYNEQSSRAHCVLTLTVRQRVGMSIRESKVRLVDLAGNERWDTMGPGMSQQHARELTAINKSLHVLGSCIQVLSHAPPVSKKDGQPVDRHVPYRDSALTMLLRDSLSGNSYMLMVCTICSSTLYQVQTLCTLRFADRAKRVKMKARVCDTLDPKAAQEQTQAEVEYLRTLVAKGGASEELKQSMAQLQQEYSSLEGENRCLRRQIAELEKQQQDQQLSPSAALALTLSQRPLAKTLRRICSEPALPGPDPWFDLEDDAELTGDSSSSNSSNFHTQDFEATRRESAMQRGRSLDFLREAPDSVNAAPNTVASLKRQSLRQEAPSSQMNLSRVERVPAESGQRHRPSLAASGRREVGRCPKGHHLLALGSGLKPLPAAAEAAYSEWHCDTPGCIGSSANTPELGRFHCAACQHDLCQNCHEQLLCQRSRSTSQQRSGDARQTARSAGCVQRAPSPAAAPQVVAQQRSKLPPGAPPQQGTESSYAQPSKPPGPPRRGPSVQARRYRPASAGPATGGATAAKGSSCVRRQKSMVPPHTARSGPSADARERQRGQHFNYKLGEVTPPDESMDTKPTPRKNDQRSGGNGSSYTSFASASTAPTTPEATKMQQFSGLSKPPVPDSQRRQVGQSNSLPPVRGARGVPQSPRAATQDASTRLPQEAEQVALPVLEEAGNAGSPKVQQRGTRPSPTVATGAFLSPRGVNRSPGRGAQPPADSRARLAAPANVAVRLSALSAKLNLDSLLPAATPAGGAGVQSSEAQATIRRPLPAAFNAAATASLGAPGSGGMRALLGELDARREAGSSDARPS